jgi:hypothetical protein
MTLPDGTVENVPTEGAVQRCGPSPAEFTLTATGPGGTAQETVELEGFVPQ